MGASFAYAPDGAVVVLQGVFQHLAKQGADDDVDSRLADRLQGEGLAQGDGCVCSQGKGPVDPQKGGELGGDEQKPGNGPDGRQLTQPLHRCAPAGLPRAAWPEWPAMRRCR